MQAIAIGQMESSLAKQAIGLGIAMALIFGAGSRSVGVGILFGAMFGLGFFAYRKRKSAG